MFSEMQEKFSFGKLFACFGKRAPKKRRWKTRAEKGDGKRAPEKRYLKKIPEHDRVKDRIMKGACGFWKEESYICWPLPTFWWDFICFTGAGAGLDS